MMNDSRFEELCDQFEASWRVGQPLNLSQVLRRGPPSQQDELLQALLEIDLEYRFAANEAPDPKDYPFAGQEAVVARAYAATRRRIDSSENFSAASTDIDATQEALSPVERTIGPYQLLRVISEDEMGTVYLAEQQKPVRKRVALKVIRTSLDRTEFLRQFDDERHTLATMEHPNLAKLLDADMADSGRPYFVMELVQGVPITEFCDKYKLNLKKRLQLFIQSCDAVQHGHHKGMLHLDLKPANVLIEPQRRIPSARVINFGLAKALWSSRRVSEETLLTRFDQAIGTVQYVSPEQWERNALDVDTRSDVYSLGVLLYELLTGTTPVEIESLRGMTREQYVAVIRAEETPRPSARLRSLGDAAKQVAARRKIDPQKLGRLLRGDLDRIAGKALEKNRERRYGSAGDLGDAVSRFLAAEPVEVKSLRPAARSERIDTKECVDVSLTKMDQFSVERWDSIWEANSLNEVLSPPQRPDEIGRLGDFQVVKLLGAGGMGFVFLAKTPGSKSPFALKVMKPAVAMRPNAKRRFLREAHAAKKLKHQNIVRIFQLGDIDGTPYITMEYLQGQSLQSLIDQSKTFAQTQIIRFAREIASALAFAHSHDFVHRDIKPNNLWVTSPAGSIKVLDFGLVRDLSQDHVSLTETGVVVGSPKYMSPEQARGEKVGAPSDLFSMGSILYRLATGKYAFDGKNVTSTLLSIANEQPESISKLRPELHHEFAQLIHRLLAKDPHDRPASAADVYRRLVQFEQQATTKPPIINPSSNRRDGSKK